MNAVTNAVANEKGRLGQVIFGGNRLHHRVFRKAIHRHHGRRIARKPLCRKRIDLEKRGTHERLLYPVKSEPSVFCKSLKLIRR